MHSGELTVDLWAGEMRPFTPGFRFEYGGFQWQQLIFDKVGDELAQHSKFFGQLKVQPGFIEAPDRAS